MARMIKKSSFKDVLKMYNKASKDCFFMNNFELLVRLLS